jgi:transcriptional regulator with XRE-family HTH domain
MNAVDQLARLRPDPSVWNLPAVAEAVATRNITAVYRSLKRIGYSQQRIAALVGQSQPEVSAIMQGRRVMAYDVLLRIVEGLGIPRGRAGLAACECQTYSDTAQAAPSNVAPVPVKGPDLAPPAIGAPTAEAAARESPRKPDPRIWAELPLLPLIMRRDFSSVYRSLVASGFTSADIAALTGQSSADVLAVIDGGRVTEYDVISRILDGLEIPRGMAGMSACWCWAYIPHFTDWLARTAAGEDVTEDDELAEP